MVLQLALVVGYTVTIGVMMIVLAVAILSGQRANRDEMQRLKHEVAKIGDDGEKNR